MYNIEYLTNSKLGLFRVLDQLELKYDRALFWAQAVLNLYKLLKISILIFMSIS